LPDAIARYASAYGKELRNEIEHLPSERLVIIALRLYVDLLRHLPLTL
jgi:hypothetical protein